MPAPSVGLIRGVVLAGGLSRRMGRDKAEVMLRGRSLLAHALDRLAPQCASLAVGRHDTSATRPGVAYPVIADGTVARAGPLAGVLAALDWGAACDPAATHVATVAVDTPFLPRDLVPRLVAALGADRSRIACAASGGRLHPVAALWPVAIRQALRDGLVIDGITRVVAILELFGFVRADWPTEPYDPFLNVNTPEDLARAEAVAASLDDRAGPQ